MPKYNAKLENVVSAPIETKNNKLIKKKMKKKPKKLQKVEDDTIEVDVIPVPGYVSNAMNYGDTLRS